MTYKDALKDTLKDALKDASEDTLTHKDALTHGTDTEDAVTHGPDVPGATQPSRNATPVPEVPATMADEVAQLVLAAQAGDRAAFDELVRVTYLDTYTLAYRLTGNEEDARDVVQEAYLRAFKGLKRFRGDARFSTWMYRITANCASTHLNKRRRHRHDELTDEVASDDPRPSANPEASMEADSLRNQLQQALRDLSPKLRAVVVLRDIYDLSHEAIAEELGISESAAKVRLHRARRKLREDLFPLPSSDREQWKDDEPDARAV